MNAPANDQNTLPTIPAEFIPADGRFGCGPSKVRPAQLQAIQDNAYAALTAGKSVDDATADMAAAIKQAS